MCLFFQFSFDLDITPHQFFHELNKIFNTCLYMYEGHVFVFFQKWPFKSFEGLSPKWPWIHLIEAGHQRRASPLAA